MSELCSFCDKPAETEEHVIPKWLQRYFNLWDQRFRLWNGTSLSYRQAVIPACKRCNAERFSRLEQKVQGGTANKQELYLWALKIRYGLALRDSTLLLDRRNADRGSLVPRNIATYGETFIRHAFRAVDQSRFSFRPFPLGSVFLFPQGSTAAGTFGLVDVPPPYWALTVVIPENKILAVLFADRGVTKQLMHRYSKLRRSLESLSTYVPDMEPRALMFTLLRWQNHLIIPSGLTLADDGVISEPIPRRIRIRKQRVEWYREIAAYCGLDFAIADEAFARDTVAWKKPYVLRC